MVTTQQNLITDSQNTMKGKEEHTGMENNEFTKRGGRGEKETAEEQDNQKVIYKMTLVHSYRQ